MTVFVILRAMDGVLVTSVVLTRVFTRLFLGTGGRGQASDQQVIHLPFVFLALHVVQLLGRVKLVTGTIT